ncbi:hypothetical protein GCM10010156_02590 [Planobispora rosea]|uniref:Uncharacterized protein n=1 Tax=Planobispora rosea TaxID=35762 RepID=A0A8J3S226_PLARO|nr:hypothetical protein [Planobispora rosea]GGS47319.1 hypothetical protein GCM10010156_02590 [Planobispora rosea]GIH82228.1 hypothetical protein Pro02_06360 [Planobispora rosea]
MIRIELTAPGGPYPAGKPVPVTVSVVSTSDVLLVGVLDGSEDGSRYPRYRPSISRDGRTVAAPPAPEDPLVGPLRVSDFVRLAPGEPFDPCMTRTLATFETFVPDAPGSYTYELTLDTESDTPEQWLGRVGQTGAPEVLALVRQVPRLRVSASPLTVEVRSAIQG